MVLKRFATYVGGILVVFFVGSCQKEKVVLNNEAKADSIVSLFFERENETDEEGITSKGRRIYFQYDYNNEAWGYNHSGWLIDFTGQMLCYHNPENWVLQNTAVYIKLEDMNRNIRETDTVCHTLKQEELNSRIALIQAALHGQLSEPVYVMDDAGIGQLFGYIYHEKEERYQKVLLRQIGDERIDNNSEEAGELYEWLASIHEAYLSNSSAIWFYDF